MTQDDILFIQKLLDKGVISSPCLELGTAYGGNTCRELLTEHGIDYYGTDMTSGENVDFIANFEESSEKLDLIFNQKFSTILVLNVLEHTFDPIRVLDNIIHLLNPNGNCVFISPTVWPLHDCPFDCWRTNPNFYEEYCRRRNVTLVTDFFEYIGYGKIGEFVDSQGNYCYPKPYKTSQKIKSFISRAVHKLFDTHGRSMLFPPHVAVGGIIRNIEQKNTEL